MSCRPMARVLTLTNTTEGAEVHAGHTYEGLECSS